MIGKRLLFAIPPVGLPVGAAEGSSRRVGRFSTAIIQITWRLDSSLSTRASLAGIPWLASSLLSPWITGSLAGLARLGGL